MLEMVQSAYDILDQLHLSLQLLAVIGFVLLVTLVLSTRELAAWFFKVNSVKRELIALRDSISELKADIARLHATPPQAIAPVQPAPIVAAPAEATKKPAIQFPFSH